MDATNRYTEYLPEQVGHHPSKLEILQRFVIESLGAGILLLDSDLKVLYHNSYSKSLLARYQIEILPSLIFPSRRDSKQFLEELKSLSSGDARYYSFESLVFVMEACDQHKNGIVVFVMDTADELQEYDLLSTIKKLSKREKQLLCQLYKGQSLKQIAYQSQNSPNTVRNQLGRIFEKTHVKSQAMLLKLVTQLNAVRIKIPKP